MSSQAVTLEGDSKSKRTIPSLSPEILCIIFDVLVRIAPIVHSSSVESRKPGWLVVSHVSRSWRDTSIRHKALWTDISVASPQLFRLFVARSEPFSISVHIGNNDGGPVRVEYVQLVVEQLNRINNLNFTAVAGARAFTQFMDGLNQAADASSLETLLLSWGSNGWGGNGPLGKLTSHFLEHSLNLCDVWLSNVPFPWGVTHSNIRSLYLRGGSRPPISENNVLKGLQGLPRLEALVLEGTTQQVGEDVPSPAVALPHLRLLKFTPFFAGIKFLQSITAHPQACVHVGQSQGLLNNPWDYEPFVECVRKYFARDRVPVSVSVSVGVSMSAPPEFELVNFKATFLIGRPSTTIHLPSRTLSVAPGFTMDVHFGNMYPAPSDDVSTEPPSDHLLSAYSTNSWTSLVLRCAVSRYPYQLWDVFCSAINLQDLTFSRVHKIVLLQFLRDLGPHLAGSLLFPSLHTITFEGFAFDCPCKDCRGPESLTAAAELVLRKRNHIGHAIEHLSLRDCAGIVESVHVQKWGTSFGCTVHWDGKGRADASHNYEED